MTNPDNRTEIPIAALLARLARLANEDGGLPDENTPLGRATREFFKNNFTAARDGLLARTDRVRVVPLGTSSAPHVFDFEIDLPYKQKLGLDAPVELAPGPVRGTINYRPDIYAAAPDEPSIAVFLDSDQALFHPNYSRAFGILCTNVPPGPFPLDELLLHIYMLLSYQAFNVSDPADADAARYFALDANAMKGLEDVQPLY